LDANKAVPAPVSSAPLVQSWLSRNLITIVACAVVAVIGGVLLSRTKEPLFEIVTWSKVIVGLGLVIFIHELGHFLAAKWCDVHVQTFSIGFGPPLFGICAFRWGETNYKIAWLPLGGYVKMVGEGDDSDEGEDDPRSFKNKAVWQRMMIISAGVIMNVILGSVFFIGVYMSHGIRHVPGVVSSVDPGGPAWKKGLRSGAEIQQLGWRKNPDYNKIVTTIMTSREGRELPFVFRTFPDGVVHDTAIEPIKTADSGKPVIGIAIQPPPRTCELAQPHRELKGPYQQGTPAEKLAGSIQFGDRIVATSDPDSPGKMKPLPPDPRNPAQGRLDYFELKRRFQEFAGQPVVLELLRGPNHERVQVTVDPTFNQTLGIRLRPGEVSAVREGSLAEKIMRVHSDKEAGDVIVAVEVRDANGKKLKFTSHKDLAAGELPLDAAKLPYDLMRWAASKPSSKQVQLTVLRPEDHDARKEKTLTIDWDDNWTWEESEPFTPGSSVAINGLGLAFKLQTTIDSVQPGSPAAAANLRDGDMITEVEIRFRDSAGDTRKESKSLRADQGAFISYFTRDDRIEEATLTIGKDRRVVMKPEPDQSWPMTERGLIFEPDVEFQKADGFGSALVMGLRKTLDTIEVIYQSLRSLATLRVSVTQVYGPVGIAKTSYEIAGENIFDFLVFLALININLAVVNFLPIPVLDGGHMVFLLYEWLRGKPPSDRVRFIATIIGLVFVLSLMVLALGMDINRYVFKY
jgi:regulator of sigma E protease